MTSAFSTNNTECLSRETDDGPIVSDLNEIWNVERLDDCIKWINLHKFNKVSLQFPDHLISVSTTIFEDLRNNTSAELCILGDTSYGSCCVDEIAASQLNADAIIHFGHACLSKVARLPVYYVFPNFKFDAAQFFQEFQTSIPNLDENCLIFYSSGLFYHSDDIRSVLAPYKNVSLANLSVNEEPDHLCWRIGKNNLLDTTCVWIGDDDQTLFNLSLTVKAKKWLHCDRNTYQFKTFTSPMETNWMRRRNFLIEKCKDAQALGIVVGAFTKGYLAIVERIQSLARDRGTRTYLLPVGKINSAKLANFLEIDCFVFIGCPENSVYNSRDFYKPLITVFDAEVALNPAWREQYPDFYSIDFNEILPNGKHFKAIDEEAKEGIHKDYDVSLISGRVRQIAVSSNDETSHSSNVQIEKKSNQLMNTDSSNSFNNRAWTGLSPDLGEHEPVQITKGRSGIAMKYSENVHP